MSTAATGALLSAPAAASLLCGRCGAHLRAASTEVVCDPCRRVIESCRPFLAAQAACEQAPPDVNLLELVAGIMLIHDALHPREVLYVREALAEYGVDVDHVQIQQVALKLKRRHRLILEGEPRKPGYRVVNWLWTARRTRSSVAAR